MSLTNKYALEFGILTEKPKTPMTSSFKSTSRSQKSMFTQRYIRDFNNLQYQIGGSLIKSSPYKSGSQQSRRAKKSERNSPEILIRRTDSAPKTQKQRKVNVEDYDLSSKMIQVESRQKQITRNLKTRMQKTAPQTGFLSQSQFQKPGISTFGLSEFQVEKTIVGKIAKRYSHHVQFQKQPNRPQNLNKIWYKKEKIFTPLDRQDKSISLKKIHRFQSNSPHKAFTPKGILDKFYPVGSNYKNVQPRSDIKVRKMQKVKDRDPLPVKEGTQLDYNKLGSLRTSKMSLFRICRSQRKLKFSKEVISPERGCYR